MTLTIFCPLAPWRAMAVANVGIGIGIGIGVLLAATASAQTSSQTSAPTSTPATTSTTAQSRDPEAGRLKAQACAVCHGAVGLSTTPDAPHLAAQPAIYIEAQLRAYRSGARRHEVMAVMARPLSDDDIANLAAWFSSIRVEAQAPR